MTVPQALVKLSLSKFRGRFKLSDADRAYVAKRGMDVIRRHAYELMAPRVFSASPANAGRQTPMKGHPVFKAMHATATCCRGCMNRWWRVPAGVALTARQRDKVVNLVTAWIEMQMNGGVEELKRRLRGLSPARPRPIG